MLEQAPAQLHRFADVRLGTLSGGEQDVDPWDAPVVHRQPLDVSAPDVRYADGVNGQVGDDRGRSIRGNLNVDGYDRCAHPTATVVATPDGSSVLSALLSRRCPRASPC